MDFNLDSLELMHLIGLSSRELDNPARFTQFQQVAGYFNKFKDPRRQILNLVFKHPSNDKLDTLWGYVRLQMEKQDIIESLDPNEYDATIQSELERGILSLDKQKQLKEDLSRREQEENRATVVASHHVEREKVSALKQKLTELETIQETLQSYV